MYEKQSAFGTFVETILRKETRVPYPELGFIDPDKGENWKIPSAKHRKLSYIKK